MTKDPVIEIAALAGAFRAALERADRSRLPITFRDFPHGACGDAALLLAKFLEQHGHGGFGYMLGLRDGWSHAWLQRGQLVVDITADQFDEIEEAVIAREGSPWHATFEIEDDHPADFMCYDPHTRSMLAQAYCVICNLLPADMRPGARNF